MIWVKLSSCRLAEAEAVAGAALIADEAKAAKRAIPIPIPISCRAMVAARERCWVGCNGWWYLGEAAGQAGRYRPSSEEGRSWDGWMIVIFVAKPGSMGMSMASVRLALVWLYCNCMVEVVSTSIPWGECFVTVSFWDRCGKGGRSQLLERPCGCCAPLTPDPFTPRRVLAVTKHQCCG